MNSWALNHSTTPYNTYISNELGMKVTIWNDTDDGLSLLFLNNGHIEFFSPREKKFYNRFLDGRSPSRGATSDYVEFVIGGSKCDFSPLHVPSSVVYNIPKYVNNVVIRKVEGDFPYQPSYFFSTSKFVG